MDFITYTLITTLLGFIVCCQYKIAKKLSDIEVQMEILNSKQNQIAYQNQATLTKCYDHESMLKETDQGVQFLIDLESEYQQEKEVT